jgi:outer membrane protein OmpA-like peptidoglycan-associated protein
VAQANVEIGGTAGIHVFSNTNELGVNDVADANSEHNSALFGLRLGVFFTPMFGVEGEFAVIPSESRTSVFDVWNITYRAQLVAQFRAADPQVKLVPFAFLGLGAFQIVDNGGAENDAQIAKDTDAALFLGAGVKYRVDNGWGLRADVRLLFPPSSKDDSFTEDFEALLSIYKDFGRKKVEKPIVPVVDNDPDKDGIVGEADKCPNEAEDKDGFQDEDGCPDPDNDGDGVLDAADKCPNEPEDKDGFQDEDGCPDPDNDGDGILDVDDLCPNDPEDKDGFEDQDGCPDLDNDKDRIPDKDDKCPNEPETYNGFEDQDGCPDRGRVVVTETSIDILDVIYFEYNSATIKSVSYPILDAVAATMQGNPSIQLIEIQGHTDERGDDAYNLDLSDRRAKSVMQYFTDKGVDSKRLTAQGYGETQPLDRRHNEPAWAKNRRVAFLIIKRATD